MSFRARVLLATLPTAAALLASTSALAAPATDSSGCDRACMTQMANRLVASMVAHRPQDVPLTEYYKATDQGVPSAIAFMDLWRTLSGVGAHQYYIDTVAGQMMMLVTVKEGKVPSLLWGRLKFDGRRFSEVELYLTRSRGDAGFIFGSGSLAGLPSVWTRPIAARRLPSRDELLRLGKAMFDNSIELPGQGSECALMENGGMVKEEPEWLSYNAPQGEPAAPVKKAAHGKVSVSMTGMGCPLFPGRPTDDKARVVVADTELGVVVTIASLQGLIYNYPVTNPTWSAFVPNSLRSMHEGTLRKALASGKYRQPKLVTMPAAITVGQLFRVFDGKIQGFHMVQRLGPTGGQSAWTGEPIDAPGNGQAVNP